MALSRKLCVLFYDALNESQNQMKNSQVPHTIHEGILRQATKKSGRQGGNRQKGNCPGEEEKNINESETDKGRTKRT